jgi:hypothetical protein
MYNNADTHIRAQALIPGERNTKNTHHLHTHTGSHPEVGGNPLQLDAFLRLPLLEGARDIAEARLGENFLFRSMVVYVDR